MDYRNIEVVHGQTDRISRGMGAFASRVTVMTGSATRLAADAVKEVARGLASDMLEARAEDLEYRAGAIGVRGQPDRSLTLAEIASAQGGELASRGVVHHRPHDLPLWRPCSGGQTSTPIRGQWRLSVHVVAYDVGPSRQPDVDRRTDPGRRPPKASAVPILEEFLYDHVGQPLVTSFMDYLMPTASETPAVEMLLSEDAPSPLNPLGVKGAGEGGTNGLRSCAGHSN